ncbi:MAG: 50S ribosomal protein L18 [Candidatus Nanoarchaeia archaeon]|nr:50S ribosomal protein L18 [Candidatus Nanoarchaeia archaeon]
MPRLKHKAVQYRRKREGKTDYKTRLKQALSGKIRLVTRISLKNVYAQLVEFHADGDKVLLSASTSELKKKYGWKGASRNTPSAYLVGFLVGIKAKTKNLKEAILDIGLKSAIKGSLPYAVLKGALDAGLNIPHSKEILPTEARIKGEHIKSQNFKEVKANLEKGVKQ